MSVRNLLLQNQLLLDVNTTIRDLYYYLDFLKITDHCNVGSIVVSYYVMNAQIPL